jgi:tetratricopeptide (TPR) repeat protein
MTDINLNGLRGDQRRQAIPTLRGYAYQVWQSLYLWVTLKEDEVLFLEGAEDVDILGPAEQAETVQIKETAGSGPVTLRSKDVVEAIIHYWEHRKNNPEVLVRFRFLTTAGRGMERSKPFGEITGIDYWDACKRAGTNLDSLRSFLGTMEALPEDLRGFIANSSDEVLRDQLLRPIEWDTENKARPFVEDSIKRRLISYGDRIYNLPPYESEKALSYLLKCIWDVACQTEARRLDYTDFIQAFQDALTVRITVHELEQLRRSAQAALQLKQMVTPLLAAAGEITSGQFPDAVLEPFVSPSLARFAQRHGLVTALGSKLSADGILVLKGSTGMGKSTLAYLIAGSDEGRWRRLDMRGFRPEAILSRLIYAISMEEERRSVFDYIIDDLNFDQNPALYENALASFIHNVRARGGRVIITTQGELPTRIVLLSDIPERTVLNVPALDEEEVGELALNFGCPSNEKLSAWKRIVFLNTSGHPQLAHARIRAQEAKGWPAHTVDDLGRTEDIESVRREARRRLTDLLPSVEARSLAYRLSIFTNRFRREHALHMGSYAPPISNPGEAFELLIGPWVERLDENYYRLSPLLKDAAEEVFGPRQITELHGTAAEAFLVLPSITVIELSGLFFHGLRGEVEEVIQQAIAVTVGIEAQHWPTVSRVIDWLSVYRIESGDVLFPANTIFSLLLRQIQFKLAVETEPADRALKIAKAWETELDMWDGQDAFPGMDMMLRFTALNDPLFKTQVPFPLRTIVENSAKSLFLVRENQHRRNENPLLGAIYDNQMMSVISAETYVEFAVMRCKGAKDVIDLLESLDKLEGEIGSEMCDQFRGNDYLAEILISRVWLVESKEDASDWARALEMLERAADIGLAKGVESIAAAAYRGKAVVKKEYMDDTAGGFEELRRGVEKLGYTPIVIRDYYATILMLEKRYEESLEILNELLPQFDREQNPMRVYSYRYAQICAANMGDWGKAADFAQKGEAASRQSRLEESVALGFRGDYAFALWKYGDRRNALLSFAEVLDAIPQLPDPRSNINSHTFRARVAYGINWLRQDVEGAEGLIEPDPGWFSNPGVNKAIKDQPVTQHLYIWYFLARNEFKTNSGDTIFKRFDEECSKYDLPLAKLHLEELRVKHSLRKLNLEALVSEFAIYTDVLKANWEHKETGKENLGEHELEDIADHPVPQSELTLMLMYILFLGLIRITNQGDYRLTPIAQWRLDAERRGLLHDTLADWLNYVEECLNASEVELISLLKDVGSSADARRVPALLLSSKESLAPEDRLYANLILVLILNYYSLWREDVDDIVLSWVSNGWRGVAEQQRFALRSPNITAPAILRACDESTSQGLKKAARIILAANAAVPISIPADVMDKLKRVAGY